MLSSDEGGARPDVIMITADRDITSVRTAGQVLRGLRPEEAVAVALPDCRLPSTGWGWLILYRTRPQAGKRWTDSGEFHDKRGLKNRPPGETRVVPLPLHLVAMWCEHVATFGTADDGRLFFTEPGRSSVTAPTTGPPQAAPRHSGRT
ncbi:hypothetical protein [Streptomyces sp. NPDC101776]|uniref:hypothetical protein n=1 Tax=Streptomyces sp. NPDC101776 TaxID=3366146 RepID=UPI003818B0A4